MPKPYWRRCSQDGSGHLPVVVAISALLLAAVPARTYSSEPVDGPAGYEVAGSIHLASGYRACNEFASARSCDTEPN
jgi:hypothetical protein